MGGGYKGVWGCQNTPPRCPQEQGRVTERLWGDMQGLRGGQRRGSGMPVPPPHSMSPPVSPRVGWGRGGAAEGCGGGGGHRGDMGCSRGAGTPHRPVCVPPSVPWCPQERGGDVEGLQGDTRGTWGTCQHPPCHSHLWRVPPPVSPTAAWGHGEATGRVRGGLRGDTGGCHCHPVCFCVPPGVPSQQAPGRMGDPRPAGSEAGAGAAERSQDPHQERAARLPARFPGARSGEGTAWGQLGGDDGDTSPGEGGVGCCRARGGHVGTGGGLGGCARERGQAWGDTRESIVTGDSPGGTP